MSYATLSLLAICVVLLIRNQLVYRYSIRKIRQVYVYNENKINTGAYNECLNYEEESGDYMHMLFDFRKWTYNQFYGDIE